MFKALNLKFAFRHQRNRGKHRDFTVCEAFEASDNWFLCRAYAFCSPHDQFNKEIGRKTALTRTLENLKLNKAARAIVWKAYFDKKRGVNGDK